MTDENGANKLAVGNVFGPDMRKRTVSCQWHFLQCAHKQLQKLPNALHQRFKELVQGLVKTAVNVSEYTKIYNELAEIANKYKCLRWLKFWHDRHAHFVPTFHGFMLPGLNIAEAGQGAMDLQVTHILSLVDCTYKDIAFQMWQDTKYKAELNNEDVMRGRSLNYAEMVERECKLQEKWAHIYGNSLQHGDMNLEQTVLQNPECFVPEESASHKFIDVQEGKNKQKKKKQSSTNMKCKMSRPASNIQIQAKTFTHATLGTDDDDCKLLIPEDFEQEFLKTRVPTVVFYNKSFKTCYAPNCKYQWDPKYMEPPFNMLFHMKTQRKKPTLSGPQCNKFLSNAYYCLQNLECLWSELPGVQMHHIYMGNFYFQGLTDAQIGILKQYGYWKHIVANRKKNIAEYNLKM